ncbi:MAG: hypothetical protein ACOY32_00705 [Thermodesulfobacteriota bacterium]
MRQKRYTVALLAMLLVFPGCGGNDQSSEKAAKQPAATASVSSQIGEAQLLDPCRLILPAEAGEILGEAVKEGEYGEQQVVGMKKCFYESAAADSMKFLQITVQQAEFMPENVRAAGQSPQSIFADTKEMLAQGRIDLTGFGEEAFIGTGGLHMLAGGRYITIGVGNPERDDNRKKLETAARLVLEKLGR